MEIHIIPGEEGGWDISTGGKKMSHHRTQEEAVNRGILLAQQYHTSMFVHGNDGRVRKAGSHQKQAES